MFDPEPAPSIDVVRMIGSHPVDFFTGTILENYLMKILKNILAVAVIATSAQSAFAYWDTGVDVVNKAGVNDGEAILTIWDATNQRSYSQDLGVKYSVLYSGAAFNGSSISLDASALSVFGGDFSSAQWNISAANTHVKNGTVNAYAGAGYILSYQAALQLTAPAGITTNVNSVWNTFAGYQTNLAMGDQAVAGNQVRSGTAAGSNETGYQSIWTGQVAGRALQDWDFIVGGLSTQNLWFTGYGNAAGTLSSVLNLGSVTLNVNSKTLAFNSAAAPAVPVPAAAWLMGSALLGLGGVGRSRKQRA